MLALHEEDPSLSGGRGDARGRGVGAARRGRDPVGLRVDDGRPRLRARRATRRAASTCSTSPPARRSRRSCGAKAAGIQVTCEATPHHLLLTDEDVRGLDTNMKMNPPLRAPADREALIEALRSGAIDCVATDHAPHAREEKEQPFELAPMGVTGLETAFAALHTGLVLPGLVELGLLVERMTAGGEPFGLATPSLAPGLGRERLPRRPRCRVGGGRGGLREPLGELRLRRPPAHRPRAHDDRRRRGRLPGALVRARGGGADRGGRLPAARGRHALRRRGGRGVGRCAPARSSSTPPCPATRRRSPTRATPARSSSSPTR